MNAFHNLIIAMFDYASNLSDKKADEKYTIKVKKWNKKINRHLLNCIDAECKVPEKGFDCPIVFRTHVKPLLFQYNPYFEMDPEYDDWEPASHVWGMSTGYFPSDFRNVHDSIDADFSG